MPAELRDTEDRRRALFQDADVDDQRSPLRAEAHWPKEHDCALPSLDGTAWSVTKQIETASSVIERARWAYPRSSELRVRTRSGAETNSMDEATPR